MTADQNPLKQLVNGASSCPVINHLFS